MAAAEALALRVGQQGGAALLVDYGQDGPYADSLMAIKQHKGVAVGARCARGGCASPSTLLASATDALTACGPDA